MYVPVNMCMTMFLCPVKCGHSARANVFTINHTHIRSLYVRTNVVTVPGQMWSQCPGKCAHHRSHSYSVIICPDKCGHSARANVVSINHTHIRSLYVRTNVVSINHTHIRSLYPYLFMCVTKFAGTRPYFASVCDVCPLVQIVRTYVNLRTTTQLSADSKECGRRM